MLSDLAQRAARRAAAEARRQAVMVATMTRAGLIRPYHPLHLGGAGLALKDWGMTFAGGVGAVARLRPNDVFVVDELGESLSVETELGCRLILRGAGFDSSTEPQACEVPSVGGAPVLRPVVGELPPELRRARMR